MINLLDGEQQPRLSLSLLFSLQSLQCPQIAPSYHQEVWTPLCLEERVYQGLFDHQLLQDNPYPVLCQVWELSIKLQILIHLHLVGEELDPSRGNHSSRSGLKEMKEAEEVPVLLSTAGSHPLPILRGSQCPTTKTFLLSFRESLSRNS